MIKNLIFKNTAIPKLSKGLDVYSLRQRVIAGNIANIQTEGYQRKEVKFEETLKNAMERRISGARTNENHLPVGGQSLSNARPEVIQDNEDTLSSGANNVDIEQEVVDQAKNQIRYMYGTRMLHNNFAAIRASIKGRYDT